MNTWSFEILKSHKIIWELQKSLTDGFKVFLISRKAHDSILIFSSFFKVKFLLIERFFKFYSAHNATLNVNIKLCAFMFRRIHCETSLLLLEEMPSALDPLCTLPDCISTLPPAADRLSLSTSTGTNPRPRSQQLTRPLPGLSREQSYLLFAPAVPSL